MTNNNIQVIGIDLGGTAIKLGRFTVDGALLQSITVATPQPPAPEMVLNVIVSALQELDSNNQAVAIGLGMPGPSDPEGRIALVSINLPGWRDVPLAQWLEEKTGKPTILANDANCAGLGEAWLGAGRRFKNFIMLTLGTGVGGAVFIDGKLFIGHHGAAGELGLISLHSDGPECNSGNQGSLEQFTSIRAIRRRTGKEPSELGELAETGNVEALNFWQEYGRDLGIGLTSLIYVLTPQAILIGGGVGASAKFFIPSAKAEIEKRVFITSRAGLEILPAELGNSAGMLGAAKLALTKINTKLSLVT
ncbi:glucokinase [Dulcicalothrix desertica PCC 7102]|uniref:Glucokinase n=1 Tax=Dulcicalothrix desertica PCC 7102 TaxID=232991 RepID=A0A3S1BAN4_9CYAN|nr:ROK family protein [Dulcicalothrix desertica]RUT08255.1 glucokinase [Dulcicalothrix desertica PCC 7102]TWH40124.1 glucokinase [Dulcicalothrix desertica PCC 7102]